MTRKFTFLLMALLALTGLRSWGQTITIGTASTASNMTPFYSNFNYSYSEMLYTKTEMGATSGTISSISFEATNAPSQEYNLDIYMKNVDKTVFSGTKDYIAVSDSDKVFSGKISGQSGWVTINLDTPFEYNGQKSLLIAIDNNTGAYKGWNFKYTETSSFMFIENSSDDTNITPANPTAGTNLTGVGPKKRANIKITFGAPCDAPTGLTVSNITANGAKISWTDSGAQSYDLAYGLATSFNLSSPSTYTLVSGLTSTSKQLTGLTAETEYKCAVRAKCSSTATSDWSSTVSFLPTSSSSLIVNDGGSTSLNVPFHTAYADDLAQSQFILPASQLTSMQGGLINRMIFEVSDGADINFGGTWKVSMAQVSGTTVEELVDWNTLSEVYSGQVSIKDKKMTITFANGFAYTGGNLLIGFNGTGTTYTTSGGYAVGYGWKGAYQSANTAYYVLNSGVNHDEGPVMFLPKVTFLFVSGVTTYQVNVDTQIANGSISANPNRAAAGTTINLTATPDFGYKFGAWVENHSDVTISNNKFTMPAHDVNISATFTKATQYTITSASVTGGTVHAEYEGQTITAAPEGTVITLVAEPASNYVFDYFTVGGAQIQGNTYTMGTSNITIGAVFHYEQGYNINYYTNGVKKTVICKASEYINVGDPDFTPAGVKFVGWTTKDIPTYQKNGTFTPFASVMPTKDYNLYAVYCYTETTGATETWEKVTNPANLVNNDDIVIVWQGGTNQDFIAVPRETIYSSSFKTYETVTIENDVISNLSENAIIFTLKKSGGNWNLEYDEHNERRTLGCDNNGSLGDYKIWQSYEAQGITAYKDFQITKKNNAAVIYNNNINKYAGWHVNSHGIKMIDEDNTFIASIFVRNSSGGTTNKFYMTQVITSGEYGDASTNNVIIKGNRTVTVNGRLEMKTNGMYRIDKASNFVFKDGAQFYCTNSGYTINATFEKNIAGYQNAGGSDGYYLIANPTNNTTVSNLAANNYDLYTFKPNQALEWNNQKPNTNIQSGIGYLYANSQNDTLQFSGTLTPAGSKSVTLTYASAGTGIDFRGFNLIGNPYACNAYVSGYNFYTLVNGEFVINSGNATIAPCTGFFVEATATGQSVTINTTAPAKAVPAMSLTISQNRGETIDRAIVRFDDAQDMHKFMMDPERTNLTLAKHGEEFAAISSNAESEIPVNFKAEKNGTYTITVETENVEASYIHLIDNKTGVDTDLLSTSSYTFDATTSDYACRFKLVFSMTGVEENQSVNNTYAYMSNGNLVIEGIEGESTLQIVDMMGRVISTETVKGSYNKALNLKAGMYIINLNGMTQKIVVE